MFARTRNRHRRIAALLLCAAIAWPVLVAPSKTVRAQGPAPPASSASPQTPLRFDAASVKEIVPQPGTIQMVEIRIYPGGTLLIQGYTLKGLLETAFDVGAWQVSGDQDWMSKNMYIVQARAPEDAQPPYRLGHAFYTIEDDRLRQMLQALLIERLQLKFHREAKTGVVSDLERSDKTLRLTPTKTPDKVVPGTEGFCSIGRAAVTWVIFNCRAEQIAHFASSFVLHHPVIDKPGLDGRFDFRYQVVEIDPSVIPDNDSSFPYAVEAMGLKLRQNTGPVETFVIDHAEKPSPN